MFMRDILKSHMVFVLAIGMTMVSSAAFAQEKKAEKPAKPKKAWVKFCEDIKIKEVKSEKTASKKVCMTLHEQRVDIRTGAPLISVALRKVSGQEKEKFMLTVPLGMVIPTGVGVKFGDEKKAESIKYTYCHRVGCVAEATLTPAFMKKLQGNKEMLVLAVSILNGKTIAFKVPLTGFDAVHKGKALDAKKYTKARNATIVEMRKRYVALLKKKEAEKLKNADKAPDRSGKKEEKKK